MAKIFKVSGYIVDVNGDSNVDEVIAEVSSGFDGMINQHIHVEEADIGEWDDESPLNYDNCDLADCEKYFKRKVPVETDRKVEIGKTYRHFKGHTVKVLHIAQDTEAPGQFYVVYECEDGAIWSRHYGMFVSEVDHVKYPNVKQKYRFELVEDEPERMRNSERYAQCYVKELRELSEKLRNHGINVPRVIEVQHDYLEQKKIPSKRAEFLTKRMNLPVRRGDGMR